MTDAAYERLTRVSERLEGVRHAFDEMRSAWPRTGEFEGSDASGAMTVVLSADGDVQSVRLAGDWRQRLEVREFVRALNEARGQATVKLTQMWVDDIVPEELDVKEQPHTRRQVSLDEYRSRRPAPTSLDDLSAKFALAAAARAEYDRYKVELEGLTRRERFESPAGLFRAVRMRAELVSLEAEPDALTFRSDDEIGRDIVAAVAEARRRDEAAEQNVKDAFPALAELRAYRASAGV